MIFAQENEFENDFWNKLHSFYSGLNIFMSIPPTLVNITVTS